ncbi:hypothetical protein SAMN05444166_1595 [Singulisphaera sp. GP187]|uniref:hypothetical protein n=1 Tax=Singulisphaera sp. GP187 TaxID=1882752 RepID=UPI000927ABA1|nr:hypothetical protein [Singulisphaera sp. GP187]SIN91567.1 hypothetical protein SAMN05444166_1595 [Singulisphaera sp. GP187]
MPELPPPVDVEGRWGTFAEYPDGALEMPIVGGLGHYELDEILQGAGVPSLFSHENPDFDSQPPFPPCRVTVVLDDAYQQRLPQPGVKVWVIDPLFPHATPLRVDRLRILVMFARRVVRDTRRAFARELLSWAESVADRGILGDGPAALAGDRVTFDGLGAEFHVDLSRSGSATLNWLILSILNFGRESRMVQGVAVGKKASSDFEVKTLGFPAGQPITLTVSPDPVASAEPPDGGPPLGSQPDLLFRSGRFRVLNTPGFRWEYAWDRLQTTIYFATKPPRRGLRDVVRTASQLSRRGTIRRSGRWGPQRLLGDLGRPLDRPGPFQRGHEGCRWRGCIPC